MDVGNIAELNTFLVLDAVRSRGRTHRGRRCAAISAATIDENNHYGVVNAGGTYVDPTYVAPGGR